MNRPPASPQDRYRQNGTYTQNGSTPHPQPPDEHEKPGVHGIKPGWLAASMTLGALLWVGIIAIVRQMNRRTR